MYSLFTICHFAAYVLLAACQLERWPANGIYKPANGTTVLSTASGTARWAFHLLFLHSPGDMT